MDEVILTGVTTNNLKDIDVNFPKKSITVVYGRSGAGKSSLAFATLYKLCKDEFEAIEMGFSEISDYELSNYEGILPAVAISQHNTNNNPRSTLYSYLKIPQIITSLGRSNKDIPDYQLLKLNTPRNECPNCKGLGEVRKIVPDELYDEQLTLEEDPFSFWNSGALKDYYKRLLLGFSQLNGIATDIPFKELPKKQQSSILYNDNKQLISFSYKHNKRRRQKKDLFIGAMLFAERNKDLKLIECTEIVTCNVCYGSTINPDVYAGVQLFGLPMMDFLINDFSSLTKTIKKNNSTNMILRVFQSICDMGLGYLHLARSIPTLSGGEIQKLNFSRLLNTDISGILIVIDEISSQLSQKDFSKVQSKIENLSKTNTIVLVEHNQYFIDKAHQTIHIGRQAGKLGGYLCEDEKIEPFFEINKQNEVTGFYEFTDINLHNVKNQNVKIPKGCITALIGPSGSGKSTIATVIQRREAAFYISQRIANYSTRSNLATTIKINVLIAKYFSKKTSINEDFFLAYKKGGCKNCQGIGVVKYERGYDKDIYLTCEVCEGRLFDIYLSEVQVKVDGLSIIEVYELELRELLNYFTDKKITKIIKTIEGLELAHLNLNRRTQSLSGGELRRARMCSYFAKLRESKKILILDEPTAGLDPNTASKVASFIYNNTHLYDSIILIEHKPEVIRYADYKIVIGPQSGSKGGKVISQGVNR